MGRPTFQAVARAAQGHWIHLYGVGGRHCVQGHVADNRGRSFDAVLEWEPPSGPLVLSAVVAEGATEPCEAFLRLLHRINAEAPLQCKGVWEPDHGTIRLLSAQDFPDRTDIVSQKVARLYAAFKWLLNNQMLVAALEIAGARWRGVSLVAWRQA